jgi:hypothetical protein
VSNLKIYRRLLLSLVLSVQEAFSRRAVFGEEARLFLVTVSST